MPTCPNCGSQQPDGADFCDQCGAKLEQAVPGGPSAGGPGQATAVATTCPECGAPVMPGEAFCENCGADLSGAQPTPPPEQASGPQPGGGLTCPQCGAQLEPGSNFCDMCGAPVSQQPIPQPQSEQFPPPGVPDYQPQDAGPYSGEQYPSPQGPPQTPAGRFVVQGSNAPLHFPPGKTEFIIGREDPVSGVFPEIDLTDHGGDEGGVSRQHARVTIQGTQVSIEDLNSTNFTYVNQQKLTPAQSHPLNDGDEVRLGRVKLDYYSA